MKIKGLFLLFWLAASIARASDWYVSTNGVYAYGGGSPTNPWALQCALTNLIIQPGDTVWLHSGVYEPVATSDYGFSNELCWTFGLNGSNYWQTNNWVTFRSASNEWAKIDGVWRDIWQPIGYDGTNAWNQWGWVKFQDLEFYDSLKGHHIPSPSYPNGPFPFCNLKYTKASASVDCLVHDFCGVMLGQGDYGFIRGCIIWNCGLGNLDHVCYPAPGTFSGNIIGWTVHDVIEKTPDHFIMESNIIFGSGQTSTNESGLETWIIATNTLFADNYLYDYFPGQPNSDGVTLESLFGNGGIAVVTNNVFALPNPIKFIYDPPATYSNVVFEHNLDFMNAQNTSYGDMIIRGWTNGSWTIDNNSYYTFGPYAKPLFCDYIDTNADRIWQTWDQWRSNYPAFDASSTTNRSLPGNMVFVIPNQDEPKRCNIAVYNFASNNTVTVNLTGMLNSGDSYQLYNAQDYGRGAIQSGVYDGTSITVPMTNLTTAPILFATNTTWNLFQAPPMSPEFGAFVVIGSSAIPFPPNKFRVLSSP